jgi:hypothetical protein
VYFESSLVGLDPTVMRSFEKVESTTTYCRHLESKQNTSNSPRDLLSMPSGVPEALL